MANKCSKSFVQATVVFAALFALGSAGVSIWMIVGHFGTFLFRLTEVDVPLNEAGMQLAASGLDLSLLQISELVLLGSGVLYVPVITLSHFGVVNKKRGNLIGSVFFGVLALGGEVATGVLAVLSGQTMPQQLNNYLLYTMNNTFDGLPNSTNSISTAWYDVMHTYQCCGYNGINDFLYNYTTMAYYWKSQGPYYLKNGVTKNTARVPPCCCVFDSGDGRDMEQMLDANCPREPNQYQAFYSGCSTLIYNMWTLYQSILTYVGFAVGALTIAVIAAPIHFLRHMPKKRKPKKPAKKGKYSSSSYGRGG